MSEAGNGNARRPPESGVPSTLAAFGRPAGQTTMPSLPLLGESLWATERGILVRGVLRMPRRMTVIAGPDGLTLHSPVPVERGLLDSVRQLGPVARLIVPNLKHDRFLVPWLTAFPAADFRAPPGFRSGDGPLPRDPMPLTEGELEEGLRVLPVKGMPGLRERVLVHPPSRSLIVADLLFNLQEAPDLRSRLIMRLNDSWKKARPSRFFRFLIKDRVALRRSLDRILEQDFDRIVVGHGDVIERNGRTVLRTAFAWL